MDHGRSETHPWDHYRQPRRVTLGARTYPSADVEGWLREVGFGNVRTKRTRTGVGFVLGERL